MSSTAGLRSGSSCCPCSGARHPGLGASANSHCACHWQMAPLPPELHPEAAALGRLENTGLDLLWDKNTKRLGGMSVAKPFNFRLHCRKPDLTMNSGKIPGQYLAFLSNLPHPSPQTQPEPKSRPKRFLGQQDQCLQVITPTDLDTQVKSPPLP